MMLDENTRNDMIYVMRSILLGECKKNPSYFGETLLETAQFIREDATYEQMLNLVFNSKRKEKYLSSDILESLAVSGIVNELENMFPQLLKNEEPISESKENEREFQTLMVDICESFNLSTEEKTELLEHAEELEPIEEAINPKASFLKMYNNMKTWVQGKLKANPNISKYGKWVTASVAAAGAATWVYKKYLSSNAQRCAGKVGDESKDCIKNIKISAEKSAISALRTASTQCNKATNPMDCKAKYANVITKHESNLAKLKV